MLLVFSILELGITSSSTFLGCQATFYYTWRVSGSVRSLWDRTGTPLLCSQGLDREGKGGRTTRAVGVGDRSLLSCTQCAVAVVSPTASTLGNATLRTP